MGTHLPSHGEERAQPPPVLETDVVPILASEAGVCVLPRCDDLGFAIDTPEPSQAETPHAMPILGFRKEWFDPDFPLVHGPLVGVSQVIPFHALLIVRKKRTVDVPTTFVGSTVGFQWAATFFGTC